MLEQYFYYSNMQAQPVEVTVTFGISLHITGPGVQIEWSLADTVALEENRDKHMLWLANDVYPYARLVVRGTQAHRAVLEWMVNKPKPRMADWGKRFAIGLPCLATFCVLFGFFGPSLNGMILLVVPESFDAKLGDVAVRVVSGMWPLCENPEAQVVLDKVVDRLKGSSTQTFDVRIANSHKANALAAPGGHIIVLAGLLDDAESPEELAGVLAHEMAHVTERHQTAGLVKQLFIATLLSLGGGDQHGLGQELISMHMSRNQEGDADRIGAQTLARAHVSVAGLKAFFLRMVKTEDARSTSSFLHSHPDTAGRAASLYDPPGLKTEPIISAQEWKVLRNYCAYAPGAND